MDSNKVKIGTCAVILIVLLRLVIGWHFFYEGLYKFDPKSGFSAKGFLGQAKGPTAPLFYSMLPDLDGVKRLAILPASETENFEYNEITETLNTQNNTFDKKSAKKTVEKLPTLPAYEEAWAAYKERFLTEAELSEEQKADVESIYGQYITALREYAAEIEAPVAQFKASLKRHEQAVDAATNDTPHQRQRNWDAMMAYRKEAEQWTKVLDDMGDGLQSALGRVISPELGGMKGEIVSIPEKVIVPNPVVKSQMRLLDLSVTVGLTAIGLFMMLGLCNRLASLGAAAFLFNVCLSQFPWPTVYPPSPDMIGHFMIISKDSVELVACLVLAALPAGRWGGLDFFLWNCGGKQIAKWYGFKIDE
ncbi:MAG: hypothetical protein ACRC2T_05245 [Thermoguttaceae bacterium]